MKQKILYILICVSVWMVSCNDEDTLSPTETPENGYIVPQGNHDYDQRIVNWKERCNTFILYQFKVKELYWSVTGWLESVEDDRNPLYPYTNGLIAANADENYVGQQLDLLEAAFLNLYPDTTLARCLPLKLLLCGQLDWRTTAGRSTLYNTYSTFDGLAFNWGNENILTMTQAQKITFKNDVNVTFLKRILANGKIVENAEFYDGVTYATAITNQTMYGRGFLNRSTKVENDVEYYVEAIVSNTYEDLIAEYPATNYTNKGILNPVKDVNGLIRQRYDILIKHMKDTYGIDLQAIGNAFAN